LERCCNGRRDRDKERGAGIYGWMGGWAKRTILGEQRARLHYTCNEPACFALPQIEFALCAVCAVHAASTECSAASFSVLPTCGDACIGDISPWRSFDSLSALPVTAPIGTTSHVWQATKCSYKCCIAFSVEMPFLSACRLQPSWASYYSPPEKAGKPATILSFVPAVKHGQIKGSWNC
jgi:hypothetical protein